MDSRGILAGALAALHDAALDDSLWPRTSALIDEACGATGNALVVSERFGGDSRIHFRACYYRGERNRELERYYFRDYHHRDERVPRIRQLPDGLLVHTPDLYTEHEKKTSPAYNEALLRTGDRNGLAARLDGPDGTGVSWILANPSQPDGWGKQHMAMIKQLLPHLRRFVHIRQVLAGAQALGASVIGLLANARVGIIHLDQRGRILEVNDRALEILRRGDALSEQKGYLGAWLSNDNAKLQELLAGALPRPDGLTAAGSMIIRRYANQQKLVLCVNPLEAPPLDFGAPRVAALVVLAEPDSRPRLDAELVAEVLGLTTAGESSGRPVVGRHDRPRHRHGHEPSGKHDLHAYQACVQKAGHFPSSGPGTSGPVAGGCVCVPRLVGSSLFTEAENPGLLSIFPCRARH